jgi:hypothetical protein
MPQRRRNFLSDPGSWYIVLFMKGQSVEAVGIGEGEEVLADDGEEGEEVVLLVVAVGLSVVVGKLELSSVRKPPENSKETRFLT